MQQPSVQRPLAGRGAQAWMDAGPWRRIVGLVCLSLAACGSTRSNLAATAGATLYAAIAPSSEIEQIYYLGAFDPLEQVPPTIYRVRVRGQASTLSNTRFASGWVPAPLIDSLGGSVAFQGEKKTQVTLTKADDAYESVLPVGRRMIMFGPEGFRESPANHRLVIVMGSDPDKFFQGMDQAVGAWNEALLERGDTELSLLLLRANLAVQRDRDRLAAFTRGLDRELPGEAD